MDKSEIESPVASARVSDSNTHRSRWATLLLAISIFTYAGLLVGLPVAACLFADVWVGRGRVWFWQLKNWNVLLYSAAASYVTLLSVWLAIGPGRWWVRLAGSLSIAFAGFIAATASMLLSWPIYVDRCNMRFGGLRSSESELRVSVFVPEAIELSGWFIVTSAFFVFIRRWFGWRCRISTDPIGRRDARKIRMSVLMTVIAVAVATSACFKFEVFGPYRDTALSVIFMAAVIAFPATVALAAILWAMFSTGYRRTRVATGVISLFMALVTYFIVTGDMFPHVTQVWFWQIVIAATFLLPFLGMLVAIRGFGYRITPYSRDDFISAEVEQRTSPFDD